MAKLRITYTKSAIGYSQDQKDTIRSLGLRKLNSVVIQDDSPAIRGMVFKVRHLVTAVSVPEDTVLVAAPRSHVTVVTRPAAGAPEQREETDETA